MITKWILISALWYNGATAMHDKTTPPDHTKAAIFATVTECVNAQHTLVQEMKVTFPDIAIGTVCAPEAKVKNHQLGPGESIVYSSDNK